MSTGMYSVVLSVAVYLIGKFIKRVRQYILE